MTTFHLAQVNIAHLQYPFGDQRVAEFFENVPRINALAESSDGFIWRYEGDYPDPMVAFNMSVWASVEELSQFVYRSSHVEIFRRKGEWMKHIDTAYSALWWIEAGRLPSPEQGLEKLALLEEHGPSERAFTFKTRFEHPS